MKQIFSIFIALAATTAVGWFTGTFMGSQWGATFEDYAGNRPTVSTTKTVIELMAWAGSFAGLSAGATLLLIESIHSRHLPQEKVLYHLLQEALKQNDTNTVLVIEEKIKEAG